MRLVLLPYMFGSLLTGCDVNQTIKNEIDKTREDLKQQIVETRKTFAEVSQNAIKAFRINAKSRKQLRSNHLTTAGHRLPVRVGDLDSGIDCLGSDGDGSPRRARNEKLR